MLNIWCLCDCSLCWELVSRCRSLHCPQCSHQRGKSLLCGLDVVCRSKLSRLLHHPSSPCPVLLHALLVLKLGCSRQYQLMMICARPLTFYTATHTHSPPYYISWTGTHSRHELNALLECSRTLSHLFCTSWQASKGPHVHFLVWHSISSCVCVCVCRM